MRWRLRVAAMALCAVGAMDFASSAVPAPDDHEARMSLYAAAIVASEVAEQRCDGVKRNTDALTELKYYAGIFAVDDEPLGRDMESFRADITDQYAKLGMKGWCEAAWKAFGSDGEMVRNVLLRVETALPALRQ